MTKNRKPKTFIINHKKTKKQQNEFDRLSVNLRHIPEYLNRVTILCPSCGVLFRPDWFKKNEISMAPVKPKYEKDRIPYTGPGRWILQQVSQSCPKCTAKVTIKLPISKIRTKGFLFGDDAKRSHDNKTVFIYSLVGADQSLLPDIENKVNLLKEKLIPSIPAAGWKMHMKDLWSGNNRKKHSIFCDLHIQDIAQFADELMAIIKQNKPFIYNIAVVYNDASKQNKAERERIRDEAYILLLLIAIDEWTTKSAQPNIIFDSEKNSKANTTIHSWARDVFLGNQYSLLYGFLSKGIEIPEPKFVPPASSPGLELADFVSFVIGRYYLRRWQEKTIELDPEKMGLITYLGFAKNGDFLWRRRQGYPWNEFCEIT